MTNTENLLACLRWDKSGHDRLSNLSPDEWSALWQLLEAGAGQHFLARRLQTTNGDIRPPQEIAAKLRAHTMAVAARNLAGRSILAAAVQETRRPALLLKGVDLAERTYGNLGLRPMGDIDFLVRAEDMVAFDADLRKRGFGAPFKPSETLLASETLHHIPYCSAEANVLPLELHWRLVDEEDDQDVNLEDIWQRAVPHHGFAQHAYVMSPEDLFLYLCLHLKHHTFETALTQIWDLAEILRAPSLPIDWSCVWSRAHEWRLTETVNISLYLVSTTLGVPTQHISDWTPDASLAKHLPDILPNLGLYPRADQIGLRVARLFSAQSSWAERFRALKDGALPPRTQVRALHGRPDDTFWNDCISYLRRWRWLVRNKERALRNSLGASPVRAYIERVAALRRHLDAN